MLKQQERIPISQETIGTKVLLGDRPATIMQVGNDPVCLVARLVDGSLAPVVSVTGKQDGCLVVQSFKEGIPVCGEILETRGKMAIPDTSEYQAAYYAAAKEYGI